MRNVNLSRKTWSEWERKLENRLKNEKVEAKRSKEDEKVR
jgi:hypothetical protein